VQLAPAPLLALAVDEHLPVGQEGPGLTAMVHEPNQLEELAQPDGVAADRHVGGHRWAIYPETMKQPRCSVAQPA
jgi:hypothetical protein